jgi:hypothetical protein
LVEQHPAHLLVELLRAAYFFEQPISSSSLFLRAAYFFEQPISSSSLGFLRTASDFGAASDFAGTSDETRRAASWHLDLPAQARYR